MIVQNKPNSVNEYAIIKDKYKRTKLITLGSLEFRDSMEILEESLDENTQFRLPAGTTRSETPLNYSPVITTNTDFYLQYDFQNIVSGNVDIYPKFEVLSKATKFVVTQKGVYNVFGNCILTLANAEDNEIQTIELKLFKNGVYYSQLSTMPMKTNYGIGLNYYFPVMTLNGSDCVDCVEGDTLSLIFHYDQLVTGDSIGINLDTIYSFFNIQYDNKDFNTNVRIV
jgi:hypothetical protein